MISNVDAAYQFDFNYFFSQGLLAAPTTLVPDKKEELPLIETVTSSKAKQKIKNVPSCQTTHEFVISI